MLLLNYQFYDNQNICDLAFLPHYAMHSTDYAVCPSVCPPHIGILLKWLSLSSNILHHQVATLF